jgi:hypothetical protein
MAKYDSLGISYFNPMVDDWHAGMVPLEAQHLAEDERQIQIAAKPLFVGASYCWVISKKLMLQTSILLRH